MLTLPSPQIITERESWIIDNLDRGTSDPVKNAKMIEPGYDMMTDKQQAEVVSEVKGVLSSIGASHGKGQWKNKLLIKDTIADITLQQVLTRYDDDDDGGGGGVALLLLLLLVLLVIPVIAVFPVFGITTAPHLLSFVRHSAKEFDVIATMNLNGDYLSDALAAQVGGIGIAPGGNINYKTGHAIFEATHGTAPKYEMECCCLLHRLLMMMLLHGLLFVA